MQDVNKPIIDSCWCMHPLYITLIQLDWEIFRPFSRRLLDTEQWERPQVIYLPRLIDFMHLTLTDGRNAIRMGEKVYELPEKMVIATSTIISAYGGEAGLKIAGWLLELTAIELCQLIVEIVELNDQILDAWEYVQGIRVCRAWRQSAYTKYPIYLRYPSLTNTRESPCCEAHREWLHTLLARKGHLIYGHDG